MQSISILSLLGISLALILSIDIVVRNTSNMRKIDDILYSEWKRRFILYSMPFIIFIIVPITLELVEKMNTQLIWNYLLILILSLVTSAGLASFRRNHNNNLSYIQKRWISERVDESECIGELSTSYKEGDESESVLDFWDVYEASKNPIFVIEKAIRAGISYPCIDELLWNTFFDRFEKQRYWSFRIFGKGDYETYVTGKSSLLIRDDAIGEIFRESLNRWRIEHQIQ